MDEQSKSEILLEVADAITWTRTNVSGQTIDAFLETLAGRLRERAYAIGSGFPGPAVVADEAPAAA